MSFNDTPSPTSLAVDRPSTLLAIERKYLRALVRTNPGLGDKAVLLANTLADSGLSAAAANMVINAVYAPQDEAGRGQSVRAHWFVEAVQSRYGARLEKIRNDPVAFRTFVAEIEEVSEMRDELRGEDAGLTFHQAFLLSELGYNTNAFMGLVEQYSENCSRQQARTRIVKAAIAVKSGAFTTLEGALQEMDYMWS